jgi:hypothetical protein
VTPVFASVMVCSSMIIDTSLCRAQCIECRDEGNK